MKVYYNENERFVAQWLRNLISAGELPDGDVDDRSIEEVRPDDVRGYTQCHFFAGIGGWPLALQWARWPTSGVVWTGSPPCQPLSTAGSLTGADDRRHLWPEFHRLIAECGPPTVFGEQVADGLGRSWLAAVRLDMESIGYAFGAADLAAASVGAPHIRQRLFWVADRRMADPDDGGHAYHREPFLHGERRARGQWDASVLGEAGYDGVRRPLPQSGILPLADGVPGRVGRIRAYGNAVVPQVAAAFIEAYLHAR